MIYDLSVKKKVSQTIQNATIIKISQCRLTLNWQNVSDMHYQNLSCKLPLEHGQCIRIVKTIVKTITFSWRNMPWRLPIIVKNVIAIGIWQGKYSKMSKGKFKSPERKKSIAYLGHLWRTSMNTRRRQWHPTPVLLPGKLHGRKSLGGCTPWGR